MTVFEMNLSDLIKAYAQKRLDGLKVLHAEEVSEHQENTDKESDDYVAKYKVIQSSLGYLAALNAEQFAQYLDLHINTNLNADGNAVAIAQNINNANYHFQLQAYAHVAKICALSLCLLLGLALMAASGPAIVSLLASGPSGCMGVIVLAELISEGAKFIAGVALTGLSTFGLFQQGKSTAEEMISFEPISTASL